jgi:hypothetical protein
MQNVSRSVRRHRECIPAGPLAAGSQDLLSRLGLFGSTLFDGELEMWNASLLLITVAVAMLGQSAPSGQKQWRDRAEYERYEASPTYETRCFTASMRYRVDQLRGSVR